MCSISNGHSVHKYPFKKVSKEKDGNIKNLQTGKECLICECSPASTKGQLSALRGARDSSLLLQDKRISQEKRVGLGSVKRVTDPQFSSSPHFWLSGKQAREATLIGAYCRTGCIIFWKGSFHAPSYMRLLVTIIYRQHTYRNS